MIYDSIIIGAGPAGVSAAIYLKRAGLSVLCIDSDDSALKKAERIENYYALGPVTGSQLLEYGMRQLESFDVETVRGAVTAVEAGDVFCVTSDTAQFSSRSVVLACGASHKKVPLKDFDTLLGSGTSYCAACDGFFFRQRNVGVIGAGSYALHEARVLSGICGSVRIFTDGVPASADFSGFEVDSGKLTEIITDGGQVSGIKTQTGEYALSGLFAAVGVAGAADIARHTGAVLKSDGSSNIPGLFAAGDCINDVKQVSTAVGGGAACAMAVIKYIRSK